MKAVLMSIQPKWCELIASGKKTVEVRKTKPKLETPFKVYIYCTKGETIYLPRDIFGNNALNGKVIGEFVCDCIISHCEMANADIAEQQGCIKREKLFEYANGKELYGWHISNLVIYDKPKELNRFQKPCIRDCDCGGCENAYYTRDYGFEGCALEEGLQRPPQSWCYVEELG